MVGSFYTTFKAIQIFIYLDLKVTAWHERSGLFIYFKIEINDGGGILIKTIDPPVGRSTAVGIHGPLAAALNRLSRLHLAVVNASWEEERERKKR